MESELGRKLPETPVRREERIEPAPELEMKPLKQGIGPKATRTIPAETEEAYRSRLQQFDEDMVARQAEDTRLRAEI
jgi:hypothetical protein